MQHGHATATSLTLLVGAHGHYMLKLCKYGHSTTTASAGHSAATLIRPVSGHCCKNTATSWPKSYDNSAATLNVRSLYYHRFVAIVPNVTLQLLLPSQVEQFCNGVHPPGCRVVVTNRCGWVLQAMYLDEWFSSLVIRGMLP